MLVNWQPKRTKFKRLQKGALQKCQFRLSVQSLQQGIAGLRVIKSGRLSIKQLEQSRRKLLTVRRKNEKQKLWMKCIADIPITAKALGLRMGKGKGVIKYWAARLFAGKIIFQVSHMKKSRELKALQLVRKLLPIPTKIVKNKVLRKVRIETF